MNLKNKINGLREIWHFDNRWQILFTRLFFPGEKINIYRYKDLEVLVDHAAGDANGAREILTSDMYRGFLKKMNLKKEINVMDLGSNNGGFPLLLKSEGIKIKKLVCVEFNPHTFSRLRFNVERNLECEFIPLNIAVCGENKKLEVNFGRASTSDNIYRSSNGTGTETFKIQGLTFNEIYGQHTGGEIFDICKMDVEGAEFDVFSNPGCELVKKCRYLIIEIHQEGAKKRALVINKIKELGFIEEDGKNKTEAGRHYIHFFINKNSN